tara:strand:+ start:144 stop:785 length:642 start_codon:yes stop_codon:yes gene_type:complete
MSLVSWKFIAGVGAGLEGGAKVLGKWAMKEEELQADKEAENRAFERAKIMQEREQQFTKGQAVAAGEASRLAQESQWAADTAAAELKFEQGGGPLTVLYNRRDKLAKLVDTYRGQAAEARANGLSEVISDQYTDAANRHLEEIERLSKKITTEEQKQDWKEQKQDLKEHDWKEQKQVFPYYNTASSPFALSPEWTPSVPLIDPETGKALKARK